MPTLGPVDPRNHGAVLDGTADDTKAIQDSIDEASVQRVDASGPRGTVLFPAGSVARIEAPLVVRASRVSVMGQGYASAQLRAAGQFPVLTIEPPVADTPLAASLVPGPGHAWDLGRGWINLTDAKGAGRIDGLAALTLEMFVRLNGQAGSSTLAASQGKYAQGMPLSQALHVGFLAGSNAPRVTLRTTGSGTKTLTPQAQLLIGQRHHLVVQYDGATLAVFIDGKAVAATPMVGLIDQAPWEDFCIGAGTQTFPNQIPATSAAPVTIDAVELWSKAVFPQTQFAPPTAKDATQRPDVMFNIGMMFQCNFEESRGSLLRCQVAQKAGTLSAWLRVYGPVPAGTLTQVAVQGLVVIGGSVAVEATKCRNVMLRDLFLDHGNRSVVMRDECYFSRLQNVYCDYPERGGIFIYHASGLTSLRDITVNGSQFPVALVNNQMSTEIQNLFVGATGSTVGLLVGANDGGGLGVKVQSYNFSDEVLEPIWGRFQTPLALWGLGAVSLDQLNLYTGTRSNNAAPSIIIDGCRSVKGAALRLETSASAPAAVRFIRPPGDPVHLGYPVVGPAGVPLTVEGQEKYVASD